MHGFASLSYPRFAFLIQLSNDQYYNYLTIAYIILTLLSSSYWNYINIISINRLQVYLVDSSTHKI